MSYAGASLSNSNAQRPSIKSGMTDRWWRTVGKCWNEPNLTADATSGFGQIHFHSALAPC